MEIQMTSEIEKNFHGFHDEIIKEISDAYYDVDYSNLIYDITKGLLYGENYFSDSCKKYLGWK